ncbi:MAG TPA: hypothetical protein VNT77_08355 [Allosphingosinicella sp.]|nr:hypothetical protein [Allosphingosinicella sp.]
MAHPFTLPTLAALAVGGAGLGVYLGKSAISEIDPLYFSSPYSESKFFADLVPNPPGDGVPANIQNISLPTDYGTGCVGCRMQAELYHPVTEVRIPVYSVPYAYEPVRPDQGVEEIDSDSKLARRAARESIERYAHYQVSSEEPARLTRAASPKAGEGEGQGGPGCEAESQCEGDPTPGI